MHGGRKREAKARKAQQGPLRTRQRLRIAVACRSLCRSCRLPLAASAPISVRLNVDGNGTMQSSSRGQRETDSAGQPHCPRGRDAMAIAANEDAPKTRTRATLADCRIVLAVFVSILPLIAVCFVQRADSQSTASP